MFLRKNKNGKEKIYIVSKIFLDTNILVYTVDRNDKKKLSQARKILENAIANDKPVISTQVLQEFYSATTTKLKLDKIIAKNIIHNFRNMEIVQVDLGIIEQGIDISLLFQISFWDSLIIAAAEHANCEMIYTEDLNDTQTIRGIKIVNPFKS
jgi:predicted nucleic acid-binding protein